MTIATAGLLAGAAVRRDRAHQAVDLAVCAAALVAALAFAVPTLAAIGAGAAIGAVALGRERPTSREGPMG
jgi:hypothetical protein